MDGPRTGMPGDHRREGPHQSAAGYIPTVPLAFTRSAGNPLFYRNVHLTSRPVSKRL